MTPTGERVAGEGEKVPGGFKLFFFRPLFECSVIA